MKLQAVGAAGREFKVAGTGCANGTLQNSNSPVSGALRMGQTVWDGAAEASAAEVGKGCNFMGQSHLKDRRVLLEALLII